MGSVHKSKNSKYWHGSFWHGGKQVYRSTGQVDKGRAMAVVAAWEEAVKGRAVGTVEQARRVMAELLGRALGEGAEVVRVSCREFVRQWLAGQSGTVAGATLEFYRSTLAAWLQWLGDRADSPLDLVQREDVVAWRNAEAERVRAKTANHRLKAVRQLFRAAVAEGVVSRNPVDGLKAVKPSVRERRVRRPFTREELARVLAECDRDWRLMVLAGMHTGQRLGDIVRMQWRDVDLERGVWRPETGKTGARLWLPLCEQVKGELKNRSLASAGEGWVFPAMVERLERNGGRVGFLSTGFADVLFRAGLRRYSPHDRVAKGGKKAALVAAGSDRREQQELSFHCLRHTARTLLEEAGQPKAVIDALLGHEGDTGRIYTTVGEAALRVAAETLEKSVNSEL